MKLAQMLPKEKVGQLMDKAFTPIKQVGTFSAGCSAPRCVSEIGDCLTCNLFTYYDKREVK